MSRWPRRNRHDRLPVDTWPWAPHLTTRRFEHGSKAWRRAARGEARRCVVRALQIAERLLAGTRLRAERDRTNPAREGSFAMASVYAVPKGSAQMIDVAADVPRSDEPICWRGDSLGVWITRIGKRADLRITCQFPRHRPDCDCTTCTEIPF